MTKTLSFAAVHFTVAFTIGYLLTGSVVVGGTMALIEPACNTVASTGIAQDVWYRWTSTVTGAVVVHTCGGTIDTKIAVYDGPGCPTSAAVACNASAPRAVAACAARQSSRRCHSRRARVAGSQRKATERDSRWQRRRSPPRADR